MTDLLFKCRHCSSHHVVDDSASGKTFKCVDCGHLIQVPGSARAFKCPSCSCDLSAPQNDEGERFHCPTCKAALTVPTPTTVRLPVKRTGGWTTSPDEAD